MNFSRACFSGPTGAFLMKSRHVHTGYRDKNAIRLFFEHPQHAPAIYIAAAKPVVMLSLYTFERARPCPVIPVVVEPSGWLADALRSRRC